MAAAWNILVTARAFHDSGTEAQARLLAHGCEIHYSSRKGPLPKDTLIEQLQGKDAVIAATDPYDRTVFDACPQLKLVARCGVGIDSVNLDDASQAGVVVTNVPDAMTHAVADYCLGLILVSVRRIHDGLQCMREGGWNEFRGFELHGKNVGLVGFGKIGQAVMQRAIGFGCKILAYDPWYSTQDRRNLFPHVRFVDLEEIFRSSHVVSIHAPNLAETRHLVDADRLAMMRPDAYLINTSRGGLIDEQALMAALGQGHLAGAAIDVFQQEPLPSDHPLRHTPRLLVTPHNAFNSVEAAVAMSDGCVDPILDLLANRLPSQVCNPSVVGRTRVDIL